MKVTIILHSEAKPTFFILHSLTLDCPSGLPVGNGCVEDLVGDVVEDFLNELFLHGGKLLRGVVFGCGRELALKVFLVLGVVDKADVDSDFELGLSRIAVGAPDKTFRLSSQIK